MSKPLNTLSLLSLKCAYNTFDLSSGLVHVSIRDQIVRATLLVRDLIESGQPCKEILVVGAGIAGVCAAVEAARKKVRVVCVDTNDRPFKLQHVTSHRHVGPYMYEWPASLSRQQHFPPLEWPELDSVSKYFDNDFGWQASQPMASHLLAEKLEDWLVHARQNSMINTLTILTSVDKDQVKNDIKTFIAARKPLPITFKQVSEWPVAPLKDITVTPDFILLAAGMGKEQCELVSGVEGTKFWEDDMLWKTDVASKRVGIFGGGDGAIQDFLRAVSKYEHALALVEYLEQDYAVRELFEREYEYLLSIEQQNRLECTWSTNSQPIFEAFDKRVKRVSSRLASNHCVRRRVASALKIRKENGRVSLYCREAYFGKAYLLNRFLAHLIDSCQFKGTDEFDDCVDFSVKFNVTATAGAKFYNTYKITLQSNVVGHSPQDVEFDIVSVRFGVHRDTTALRQMLGLTDADIATRTTLAGIPVPFC